MSDDLDDDDLNLDNTFDDLEKKGTTLGDLWRNNPMVKIGTIAGTAVIILGLIILFGGDKKVTNLSNVGGAPDITAVPGTEEASPAYVQAVQETNEAAVERAYAEGTSALPVPITPPVGSLDVPDSETQEEDPLQRWRRLQEERLQQEVQQREIITPDENVEDPKRAEAVSALSEMMAQQMSSILGAQTDQKISSMSLTSPSFLDRLHEEEQAALNAAQDGGDQASEILLPAGEIVYAQILTEANTDAPGPVLAEIVSGPLKGNRVLGSFEEKEELLTLNFDTVVVNGESININAVALDPDTTLTGMASDVNHHYVKRIVLPAAAAFVKGMSNAISESGLTTITVSGQTGETTTQTAGDKSDKQEVATGIDEAGQEIHSILKDMAKDTKTTIKIHAGTPMGLLFLDPVVRGDNGKITSLNTQAVLQDTKTTPGSAMHP